MSLEDEIRTALLDKRRALPAWPDAAERVHAGMSRRLRRRRLATVIWGFVALALAVPMTLVQTNRGPAPIATGPTAAAVVPWGGDAPLPVSVPGPGPAAPPACTPADLATEAVTYPTPASTAEVSVLLVSVRNVGQRVCGMYDAPPLYRDVNGTWRKVPPSEVALTAAPSLVGAVPDAAIGPGDVALVRIERSTACPPVPGNPGGVPQTYTDLALGLGAARLPIHGAELTGLCDGAAVSYWFVPRGGYNQGVDGLLATIVSVGAARAGHPLDFVVALTNPTRHRVVLRPAPYYAITVDQVEQIYQLTREPDVIPAGGTVNYEMSIYLRTDLPLGPTQLTWELGSIGTDVGASVPITFTE